MRDRSFILNSIKMDLHRIVAAAGDISKPIPEESIREFLKHAEKDFDKIKLSKHENAMKKELKVLSKNMKKQTADPHNRLRWAEKILTVRNRL